MEPERRPQRSTARFVESLDVVLRGVKAERGEYSVEMDLAGSGESTWSSPRRGDLKASRRMRGTKDGGGRYLGARSVAPRP